MHMHIAEVSDISRGGSADLKFRTPVSLPKRTPDDEVSAYVIGMVPNSPVSAIHLCGICFQSGVVPAGESYADNFGAKSPGGFHAYGLTEKEVETIWKAAKQKVIEVPQRHDWNNRDQDGKPQSLPGFTTTADTLIFITKREEFNPSAASTPNNFHDDDLPVDDEKSREEVNIYKNQAAKSKKR